ACASKLSATTVNSAYLHSDMSWNGRIRRSRAPFPYTALVRSVTGPIGATVIAVNAVTSGKIADGAVESSKIAVDAVNAATINPDVAGNGLTQAANGSLEVDELVGDVTGPIGATVIAVNAVTSAKIENGTITNQDISADPGSA